MRSFVVILSAFLFSAGCNEPSPKAQGKNKAGNLPEKKVTSRHNPRFNTATDGVLASYYLLSDGFVKWDSASIPGRAGLLLRNLDSMETAEIQGIRKDEAKKDIAEIKSYFRQVALPAALEKKRIAFHSGSRLLFEFLDEVKYDRQQLFLQKCPMAFNDTGTGVWISDRDTIVNPYLGLHHPIYKKGMLHCGENGQVLNHTGQ